VRVILVFRCLLSEWLCEPHCARVQKPNAIKQREQFVVKCTGCVRDILVFRSLFISSGIVCTVNTVHVETLIVLTI